MTADEILERAKILGYLPEEQTDQVVGEIRKLERDTEVLKGAIDKVLDALPESAHQDFLMRMMKG